MNTEIEKYFRVIKATKSLMHVKLMGHWTKTLAAVIGPGFVDRWKEMIDQFQGTRFYLLIDLTDFETPSYEAKEFIFQTMKYTLPRGFVKAIEISPKAITRIGIKTTASRAEINDQRIVVNSLEEAREILSEWNISYYAS